MADVDMDQNQEDEGVPVMWLSFCPDLGLYHCHREEEGKDPEDVKFTRSELVTMVEGMMKSSQLTEAQQLAHMCGWARLFAHRVVVFYTSGVFRIFKNLAPPEEEQEESEDMKSFMATWQKEHPDNDSIPTVVAYADKKPRT